MFGVLAERTGSREVAIDLPEGATGADLLRALEQRHPAVAGILDRVSLAVNHEVTPLESSLSGRDEVALLPPVAGGASVLVGLRERPSVEEALAAASASGAGAVVAFVGSVRDHSEAGLVERLEYSGYPEMAEKVLYRIAEEATERWGLAGVAILHAIGSLPVGHTTVVVACAAPHRAEAFKASLYVVDELKRRVPVWKKELGPWGERWVNLEG